MLLLLLQILKHRLGECVRSEGVNYIEKCEQVNYFVLHMSTKQL